MLSRPSHAPLYMQYDFSAKEKLELYRLPKEVGLGWVGAEILKISLGLLNFEFKNPSLYKPTPIIGGRRVGAQLPLPDVQAQRPRSHPSLRPLPAPKT